MANLNEKRFSRRRGFNLAEVVVASAVMAMMMVALIGYVHSAGQMWQKSHETISLTNEGNTLLDYVERELWQAKSISVPAIGDSSSNLIYSKLVSDYQAVATQTEVDFQITADFTTGVASTSLLTTSAKWTNATAGGWGIGTTLAAKKVLLAHHNFDLCANLKGIKFYRRANRLLEIIAIFSIPKADDDYEREIEFKRMVIMR